ncbi:MAG: hypothetical protein V4563_16970 [Pseudomonadota bacterium]
MGFLHEPFAQGPPTLEEDAQNQADALSVMDPTFGGLTPQTAMKYSGQAQQPKPDENAPLPVVPRGQLAQWIQQHQAEEGDAIPSAEPSAEDQRHADVSRGIGNATGSFLSGIQNTIGILQPGRANYEQAHMVQQQGEQHAKEALGRAPAARNEAIQNMQLGAMRDEKRQKQLQMVQALKQQQDENDPGSAMSKAAQQEMKDRLMAYGEAEPKVKELAMKYAVMVSGLPAAKIKELDAKDFIGKLVGQYSNERAMGAHNDVSLQNAAATNKLGYAQLDEKIAHDKAEEEAKNKKALEVHMANDRMVNENLKDLNNADENLTAMLNNVKTGKIDVSGGHAVAQEGVNIARKWAPGMSNSLNLHIDQQLQGLKAIAPLVQGALERSVTKSSRYTPERWKEVTMMGEDSDEKIVAKLAAMLEFTRGMRAWQEGLLHVDDAGNPVEKVASNKALAGGQVQQRANKLQAGIERAMAPGTIKPLKGGGHAQQQPDGKWKRID